MPCGPMFDGLPTRAGQSLTNTIACYSWRPLKNKVYQRSSAFTRFVMQHRPSQAYLSMLNMASIAPPRLA